MSLAHVPDLVNQPGSRLPNSAGMVSATTVSTNYLLHTVSPGATGPNNAGGRTATLRKLMWENTGNSQVKILIGDTDTGAASGTFTQRLPGITAVANQCGQITEEELALWEFNTTGNIFVQVSSSVTVKVSGEVEEFE